MSKVFADAFFFLALLNKQDAWHRKAIDVSRAIAGPILTTQWVLVEVGDAFCRPSDRDLFKKLLELIEADSRVQVIGASNAQFQLG
jgi:uncharacterized protein